MEDTKKNLPNPNELFHHSVGSDSKPKSNPFLDFLKLTVGALVIAASIHFFKFPNNFATGGVSGIATVLSAILPQFPPSSIATFFNIVLLVVGLVILGKGVAFKTTYVTVAMSAALMALNAIYPMEKPFTNEPLMELFISMILSAFGAAILFNFKASSGGTDIIALILKKYSALDIGKALIIVDFLVVLSTFFIFDMQTGLFSIVGLSVKGVIVDAFIESFNRVKYCTIITSKPEIIGPHITQVLKSSATKMVGKGQYSGQERTIFLCVLHKNKALDFVQFVSQVDPHAFVMLTNTSEIVGHGFRAPF